MGPRRPPERGHDPQQEQREQRAPRSRLHLGAATARRPGTSPASEPRRRGHGQQVTLESLPGLRGFRTKLPGRCDAFPGRGCKETRLLNLNSPAA